MKQGINFELPISLEINIDDATEIRFLFVQDTVEKEFIYPSENAVKVDENTIKLKWTSEDTWLFVPRREINMDTYITMKGTVNNPETSIASFTLHPTLFKKE